MSKPLYRSDVDNARAEMLAGIVGASRRESSAETASQRRAEAQRTEDARRSGANRLARTIRDEARYRRALVDLERAETVIDVERAIVEAEGGTPARMFEQLDGETCGALCKCAATGSCSVISAEEAANGCTRPAYARDSAEGEFVVWGYNGAAFPGKPERACACGQHDGSKTNARGDSAESARAQMLRERYGWGQG